MYDPAKDSEIQLPKNEVKHPKTQGQMLQKAEELIDYLEITFG